jgi:fibronectin type 3 domain-containing protein
MRDLRLLFVFVAALLVFGGACSREGGAVLPAVDTVPPIPPVGLQANLESDDVVVRWAENAEPDLAGYRLYKSSQEEGPYGSVAGTLIYCPWYHDEVIPVQTTFYKVTAVDQSGNESAFSQIVGVYYNIDRKTGPDVPVE